MLVLFETSAGYSIFKLLDEKRLKDVDNLYECFETPEAASRILKLKQFQKFKDTTEALAATTAAVEGKMGKSLKKILKKLVIDEPQALLAVADAKLGSCIKEKLNLDCVSGGAVHELMRCIRSQTDSLISGLTAREHAAMSLGLAHSLSRYKLKFSPDKVDTMVVQAISLLDDLDKELNNYMMRMREWYGWHFPELGKIITDNLAFAKVIRLMGDRTNAASCDLSPFLPDEVEAEVKEAAEISMGTEIHESDLLNIKYLCDQVIEITEYRTELYDYLKNRMLAIAPNLTTLVGEMVGARLIAHAGSLMNLAKQPASTVQILGAEKALFRALKTMHNTPKYGLIYHAGLVTEANASYKGKISRMLAAKTALAIRVDALGEDDNVTMGVEAKAKLMARLRNLEEGTNRKISGTGKSAARFDKYENKSEVKTYQPYMDSTLPSVPVKRKFDESEDVKHVKKIKPENEASNGDEAGLSEKKKKKKRKLESEAEEPPTTPTIVEEVGIKQEEPVSLGKKKKRKSKGGEGDSTIEPAMPVVTVKVEDDDGMPSEKKKKKKKRHSEGEGDVMSSVVTQDDSTPKKSKKKKNKSGDADMDSSLVDVSMIDTPPATGSEKKKKKKKAKKSSD